MENNKNVNEERFESKHNITNLNVIRRLNTLKPKFEEVLKKEISNDEFIDICLIGV